MPEKTLAVIIPACNEACSIKENIAEIARVLGGCGIGCRFTLIDDGSVDGTWQKMCELANERGDVFALRFARNFGKEAAICAGLACTDSELYLVMDADLQHPPRYVPDMLALMERTGADIVDGVKSSRGRESKAYGFAARGFYRLLKAFTGLELQDSSDFKLLNRRVVDALRAFGETEVFFRGMVAWVGFKRESFPFEVDERRGGSSRFSTGRLAKLAAGSIISFTGRLLYLTTIGGLAFLLFAIILGAQTLYNYFSGRAVSGFSTVILLLLFTGSMIMISLGIIGAYISRIYDEVKRRPRYIISERTDTREDN